MSEQPFGAELRAYRQRRELKLTWFARRAGVAASVLSTLERGQRRLRPGHLVRMAEACRAIGVSHEELAHLLEVGVSEIAEGRRRRSPKEGLP